LASILVTLLVKLVIEGAVLLCSAAFARVLPHPISRKQAARRKTASLLNIIEISMNAAEHF
jgi:hypothetical protein